jgi:hypothetical protein
MGALRVTLAGFNLKVKFKLNFNSNPSFSTVFMVECDKGTWRGQEET